MVITAHKTSCDGCTADQKRQKQREELLALRTKDLANLAVDPCRIFYSIVDQLHPLLIGSVKVRLAEEVRGLHDGFDRIAEIVRKSAELLDYVGR